MSGQSESDTYRKRTCQECDREVPKNAIVPYRGGDRTRFVCAECATDLRYEDTEEDR